MTGKLEEELKYRVAIRRLHELIQLEADIYSDQNPTQTTVIDKAKLDSITNDEITEGMQNLEKRKSEIIDDSSGVPTQKQLYQQAILELQHELIRECFRNEEEVVEISFFGKVKRVLRSIGNALRPSVIYAGFIYFITHPRESFKKAFKLFINISRVAKKAIDLVDDIWLAVSKNLNPQVIINIGALLIGGVGFIIFMLEGYEAAARIRKLWSDKTKEKGERFFKTKLGTAIAALVCVVAGIAISIAIIATKFGAAVADATTVLPNMMPVLLAIIVATNFVRKAYVYYHLRQDLAHARAKYDLAKLTMQMASKRFEDDPNEENYLTFKQAIESLSQFDLAYSKAKRTHAIARRKLIFNAIEMAAIMIAVIGTVLGMVAASAASFGVAPAVILYTGIMIGLLVKVFEIVDKKYDHRPSKWLKRFFFGAKTAEMAEEIKAKRCPDRIAIIHAQSVPTFPTSTSFLNFSMNHSAKSATVAEVVIPAKTLEMEEQAVLAVIKHEVLHAPENPPVEKKLSFLFRVRSQLKQSHSADDLADMVLINNKKDRVKHASRKLQ